MRALGAGIAAALLGVAGCIAFVPQMIAASQPAEAARFAVWDAGLQRAAAQSLLQTDTPEAAAPFGKAAVRAMPYDQFGLAVSSIGQSANDRLIALNNAAALGWRDAPTNIALTEAAFRENKLEIASYRIDALGRIEGTAIAGPLADRLILREGGIALLANRAAMHTSGAWWQEYFRSRPETREAAQARVALIFRFDKEDGAWLRAIIRDAEAGFAEAGFNDLRLPLWRQATGEDATKTGIIYDPVFRLFNPAKAGIGGEWRMASAAPATLDVGASGGITITQTQGIAGAVLIQRISLDQGPYRFTATGEGAADVFEWQIECGDTKAILPALGTTTVAIAEKCPAAVLSLVTTKTAASRLGGMTLESVTLDPLE